MKIIKCYFVIERKAFISAHKIIIDLLTRYNITVCNMNKVSAVKRRIYLQQLIMHEKKEK